MKVILEEVKTVMYNRKFSRIKEATELFWA